MVDKKDLFLHRGSVLETFHYKSIINQPEQYLMIQMDVSKLLPIQRNVMKFWTNEVLTSVGTELVVGTESEVDRRAARGVTRALCSQMFSQENRLNFHFHFP